MKWILYAKRVALFLLYCVFSLVYEFYRLVLKPIAVPLIDEVRMNWRFAIEETQPPEEPKP